MLKTLLGGFSTVMLILCVLGMHRARGPEELSVYLAGAVAYGIAAVAISLSGKDRR